MQQYSPKNQAFLLAQMPTATDVRPFKAWKAAGRSVRKGEKALRVWIPKLKGETTDPEKLTEQERERRFVRGPVFDISQTKECAPRHRAAGETDRKIAAGWDAMDRAYTDYHAAIDAGDIPADLDFDIWYELKEETRLAGIRSFEPIVTDGATIATAAGVVIAETRHIDLTPAYAPIGGGSQELDTDEEAASDAPSIHETRISFRNAAGHLLQELAYATEQNGRDAFDALESGEGIDLPADWLTATLETFVHGCPVTERATYRTSGSLTDPYRTEFLEIATRSYQWSSHTPEKRAAQDFAAFGRIIAEQSFQWHASATTPELHRLADTLTTEYAAGYMAQYRTVASARSRVASSFVTGGSGFNVRRNAKAQATYAKRSQEMDAWIERFRKAATKRLAAITPAEDVEAKIARELKGAVRRCLVMCEQIDAGQWPGFNRQSFVTSAASRIRNAHKNGHTQAVADVLAWLKEEQTTLLASGHLKTPMLTDRHSVWSLA